MDLSIILVNWNTKSVTLQCLASIFDHTTGCQFEVIVADNGSTDGSVEAIKQHYPRIKTIENKLNVGFAKGNNAVIPKARGRYILFLNTDTIIHDDALGKLIKFMDSHPEVGACGPTLLNPDGSLQFSAAKDPSVWLYANEYVLHRYPGFIEPASGTNWLPVDTMSGACLCVRREVIEQVGGWPEDFYMYVEDVAWCQIIRRGGWVLAYVTDAAITHFGGQSSKQNQAQMSKRLLQSRKQHLVSQQGFIAGLAFDCVMVLSRLRHRLGNWRNKYASE